MEKAFGHRENREHRVHRGKQRVKIPSFSLRSLMKQLNSY